jgi:hypothetical protein
MQRYNLNLKGGTYTQQDCYRLTPIYRQQVVPGTTANIDAQVNLKTASFTKLITTPCLASVWFFYVPHRLVWDQWTEFISKSEPQVAFPQSSFLGPNYFDKKWPTSGINVSPLYRRAYKLVYNEYFNSDKNNGYDITDDSNVTVMGDLRNPEQFCSKMRLEAEVQDPEFTVVGSSIPLNEFYRAQMNARSKQRSQMTGDKYVDTLARMGVDASWMIAERPEFLGTKSKLCAPVLTASTESATLGQEVSRFNCSLTVDIKGKHFAEHGYIVGVVGLRPILTFTDRGAPDEHPGANATAPSAEQWLDMFYSADNLQTKDQILDQASGFDDPDDFCYVQRFGYLRNGSWLTGKGDSWVSTATAANFQDMIYPDRTYSFINTDELGGDEFAATSSINMSGKTPVPTRVA